MNRMILAVRLTCTRLGCHLSIVVVATCTLSETKARSRHRSSPSGSYRQASRVGLTPPPRGTGLSEEEGLIRGRAVRIPWPRVGPRVPGPHRRALFRPCSACTLCGSLASRRLSQPFFLAGCGSLKVIEDEHWL